MATSTGVLAEQVPIVDGATAKASIDENRKSTASMRTQQSPKTEKVMERAEREAQKSQRKGASEDDVPERRLGAVRSPSADRGDGYGGTTLPVVEEVVGESQSTGGRSGGSRERREERESSQERSRPKSPTTHGATLQTVAQPPSPKDDGEMAATMEDANRKVPNAKDTGSFTGRPPSTATLEERQKPLPGLPPPTIAETYTASPSPAVFRKSGDFEDMEMRVQRVRSDAPPAH